MRWLRVIAWTAVVLGVAACQPPASPPSAGSSAGSSPSAPSASAPASPPAALVPIRVAQIYTASALLPFWLALEEGYFREYGVDAEAVLMRGSVEGTAAIAGGDAHLMLTAPSPATIGASAQDPDLVILGTTNNRLQYQFVANVPTFPDLRGKVVGVSRVGDSSHYLVLQTLERYGMRGDDVSFINVGSIPERLAALLSRQIDATVVIVPSNLQAIKQGFYQLADLGDLGIPYIGTSVYMRRSVAEQNRAAIEGFLKGLMRGNHAVLTQPERSKAVLKKYLSMDDADYLEASYQDNVQGTERALAPSLVGLEDLIAQTAQQNPAIRGMGADQLVDLRLVQAIEASGFVRDLDRK